jgi:DNA-directed RNA polymerase specialized sigma subunit
VSREKEAVHGTQVISDAQFDELRKLFQRYVRVTALGAVKDISDREMPRNTWLLYEAGYTQPEIAKILGTSQPTISRILSGKLGKGKGPEEGEK